MRILPVIGESSPNKVTMSKLWLLLLLVAAFQTAQSFPTNDDNLEDSETTASILKDTWGKLKVLYTEKGKEAVKVILAKLKEKLCTQNDFEEDVDYAEEDGEETIASKLLTKIRETMKKVKQAVGEKKEQLKQELEKLRVKLCNSQIEDVEEDEEEFFNDYEEEDGDEERGFGKFVSKTASKSGSKAASSAGKKAASSAGKKAASSAGKKATSTAKKSTSIADKFNNALEKGKKKLKKLKEKAKSCMKKGREFLKNAGVKVEILKCKEKTCSSCVSFLTKKICMDMRFMRTNKATSVIFTFIFLGEVVKEIRVNLGDVPRCVEIGGFVGKICLKAIEGRVKTSDGKVKCNFCMGILSDTFGAGVKMCATYEDKKLKFKFSPKMFAGAMTEDGEMVESGKGDSDEDEGVLLDADEFELDE